MNRIQTGRTGEALAARYLQKKGYKVLERGFRAQHGEIDLIVQKEKTLIFCEVKARSTSTFGTPAQAVHWKKQQILARTAACYLSLHPHDGPMRFDVVEVYLPQGEIHHIQNAFENPRAVF